MIEAARDLQFERAARLRDEIKMLTALGNRAEKGDQQYWQPEAFVTNPQEGLAKLHAAVELGADLGEDLVGVGLGRLPQRLRQALLAGDRNNRLAILWG